jgi:hypothetical protein
MRKRTLCTVWRVLWRAGLFAASQVPTQIQNPTKEFSGVEIKLTFVRAYFLLYQAGGWRLGLRNAWRQPVSCVLRPAPPHPLSSPTVSADNLMVYIPLADFASLHPTPRRDGR